MEGRSEAFRPEARQLAEDGWHGDADLIRRVQAGSETALAALYQRYLPSLWRYVYRRLRGDAPAAEDVVSESFLAAIRGVKRIDPDAVCVCAWLTGIARHKLQDHWRRRGDDCPPLEADAVAAPARPGPHDLLEADERRARVAEAMARLRDEERLALEWKYVDELSVREIAGRIGRTEKAAEALLYRARRGLRTALERSASSADRLRPDLPQCGKE